MRREFRERDAVCHPLLVNQLEANLDYANEAKTSFFQTLFNGLNALSGVGLLTVPYALASGGWLSLVLIFTMPLAAFYTGLLIKRCMEADSTIKTFPDIGESAFGIIGRRVVSLFMCFELYMVTAGFLILEGDNLSNLFPRLKLETYGLTLLGGRDTFIIVVALVLLPSLFLSNLSIFSYISATGVLASLVTLASVLWVGVFDGIGFSKKGELVNWSGVPTALSLYGFCYCAHPVFPTLYNSMKKKHHFSKVLLMCILSSTICYTAMAIFGYLMFGQNIKEQITLNLPTNKLSSKMAIWTTLINPLANYGLMLEPVATSVQTWFPDYRKERHFRVFVRTALLTTQVLVAIFVPFFGPLMSLVGAFLSVTASITLPCMCYMKIDNGNIGIEKVVILVNIVVSILVAIIGTYTSLVQLIQDSVLHK